MKVEGPPSKREMQWPVVLVYIHLHALGAYGLWLLLVEAKWLTVIFFSLITLIAGLGITTGAHRLWAHRSYVASRPLRFFLMLAHTLTGAGSIYDWVLSHRIHHRFYGTDLDPYNHNEGFFYSHILSNMMTTHPGQEKIVRDIDMRDIEEDGFVFIQKRLYWILMPIFGVLLPMNAPAEYWGESITNSIFILGFLRLLITVHISWLVNSARIIWSLQPGDKYPADDNLMFIVTRTYWPHYHYMLPWDYKSGEFGTYDRGCSTSFIQIWEHLGLASVLKSPSSDDIRKALAKIASKGVKFEECLPDIYNSAEEVALRKKLAQNFLQIKKAQKPYVQQFSSDLS